MSSYRKSWSNICLCLSGLIAATVTANVATAPGGAGAERQPAKIFYAPKPIQPMPYVAPMKPLVRLADLKAKHAGQANWTELVVYDKNNRAEVISAAPGSKVPRHLHSDAPEYWVVEEGRIRFEIEDPPGKFKYFEAAKGDLVLAPERRLHSLEVIGTEPAIRFQATLPDTTTVYETKPAIIPMKCRATASPIVCFLISTNCKRNIPGNAPGAISRCAKTARMPISSVATAPT
jgi:mannose-6-phosphate isomerase-like protein (cupin superfamily)